MSSQPKPDGSGGPQRTQAPPNVENEAPHAERRQLTVAFIDIVGSTPLSERIDPEEFSGLSEPTATSATRRFVAMAVTSPD